MAKELDISKILSEGATYKRGGDESGISAMSHKKPKAKRLSGAAKMRADYKMKKNARSIKKK